MPHKSADVICQCGAILKVYYMPKHLRTAKHACDMIVRMYVCMYVCMYIHVTS